MWEPEAYGMLNTCNNVLRGTEDPSRASVREAVFNKAVFNLSQCSRTVIPEWQAVP